MTQGKTDYEFQKEHLSEVLSNSLSIGQEVKTPDGVGIITSIKMPQNGLYLQPHKTDVVVWYSTEKSQNGWVSREYDYKDVSPI